MTDRPDSTRPLLLYFFCTDVEDPVWFTEWFAHRHAPVVIEAGFDSASCYLARSGRQAVWDVYEIASADVFETPAYSRTRQQDPELSRAMDMRSNWSSTLYECDVDSDAILDAEALVVVRWSSEEVPNATALKRAYDALHAEGQGRKGVTLARRGDRQHPLRPSTEPDGLLLLECRDADMADAVGRTLQGGVGLQRRYRRHRTSAHVPRPNAADAPQRTDASAVGADMNMTVKIAPSSSRGRSTAFGLIEAGSRSGER